MEKVKYYDIILKMILYKWRVIVSKISYKRLFKKMIDLDMKNTELMKKAKVSKSTFYKMKNGQNVTTDVLLRICNALNCNIEEIVECVEED